MSKNSALAIFLISLIALLGLAWLHTGSLVPPSGDASIWFHAGLLTLLVGRFVVEYRFTRPNDVFVNCLVVFASTSTLSNPPYEDWWTLLKWGSLICGSVALALAWDPGREAKLIENRMRTIVYTLVTRLGRAEVIFSLVFVLALLSYFDKSSDQTKLFVLIWGAFLLSAQLKIGPIGQIAFWGSKYKDRNIVALAHSFLAPSFVFSKKLGEHTASPHELVGFTQSANEPCHSFGLVVGQRSSTTETRYATILLGKTVGASPINDRSLMVTVSQEELEAAQPPIDQQQIEDRKQVVGSVVKGTSISRTKFEVFGVSDISAGRLLKVNSGHKEIFYQVFEGVIDEETTIGESARNFVEGEAEQVGYWDNERGGFETHDWVAPECAPVFMTSPDTPAPNYEAKPTEKAIGRIPLSNYPANIDLHDLILFHTAILGVTGAGKSYLTYHLIEQTAAQGIKVVCIDPTGDYQKYLHDAVLLENVQSIRAFLDSDEHFIGVVETADRQGTPIENTRDIAKLCLDWCKRNRNPEQVLLPVPKVLVVLEEAHLLVPEWNFVTDHNQRNIVNATSQIVLQARKYGLGFLAVSQRTANVVKSVLNQCNTIISFQAFDETGFDFLKNYMGTFHVRSLPNLKPRHGIIVGKASRSRRPVMVHFNEQDRRLREHAAPPMPLPARDADEGPAQEE